MYDIIHKAKLFKYIKPNNKDTSLIFPESLNFIDIDNFEGFYFTDNNILYFFFNGTNEISDWVDNFNILSHSFYVDNTYCGKLHKGFFNYYSNVRELFLNIIKQHIGCSEIHICGYSLGSSCVIGALEASFIPDCPPITVVTFGSPRVGNNTFTKLFNKRIHKSYRIANSNDPVTKVPLPIRFKHVNNCIKLNNTSCWHTNSINNHSINTYITNLDER